MPRGKQTWTAKQEKEHEKMKQDLADTLEKHRQEMEKMSEENGVRYMPGDPEEPEPEHDTLGEPDGPEEPESLSDPTEDQDLTHDLNLTMEEFCDKTLNLLDAATKAVQSMRIRFGNYDAKISKFQLQLKNMNEFERALGFKHYSFGKWATPRLKPCWKCGQRPSLQMDKYSDGWTVLCEECWTRTESADGPMAAIRNWNDGKETEISQILNQPLSRKE